MEKYVRLYGPVLLLMIVSILIVVHYVRAPEPGQYALPPIPGLLPPIPKGFAAMVMDSKGRVKPALYEEAYPLPGMGEKMILVPTSAVYPWSFARGNQLVLCSDVLSIKVISSVKKEWLFAQVQRELDSGRAKVLVRDEAEGDAVMLLVSVQEIKAAPLREEAWDVVKKHPHADQLLSLPAEKKKVEAEIVAHLGRLHDTMDLHKVEIVPNDTCRPGAQGVEL